MCDAPKTVEIGDRLRKRDLHDLKPGLGYDAARVGSNAWQESVVARRMVNERHESLAFDQVGLQAEGRAYQTQPWGSMSPRPRELNF